MDSAVKKQRAKVLEVIERSRLRRHGKPLLETADELRRAVEDRRVLNSDNKKGSMLSKTCESAKTLNLGLEQGVSWPFGQAEPAVEHKIGGVSLLRLYTGEKREDGLRPYGLELELSCPLFMLGGLLRELLQIKGADRYPPNSWLRVTQALGGGKWCGYYRRKPRWWAALAKLAAKRGLGESLSRCFREAHDERARFEPPEERAPACKSEGSEPS